VRASAVAARRSVESCLQIRPSARASFDAEMSKYAAIAVSFSAAAGDIPVLISKPRWPP
jgi:hypothetical protein